MTWKAVLSANINSITGKKRNVQQLKNLTIEQRRERILQARGTLHVSPVPKKFSLGTTRKPIHSKSDSEENDIPFIPVPVEKEENNTGTLFLKTEISGSFVDSPITPGYADITRSYFQDPTKEGEDVPPVRNFSHFNRQTALPTPADDLKNGYIGIEEDQVSVKRPVRHRTTEMKKKNQKSDLRSYSTPSVRPNEPNEKNSYPNGYLVPDEEKSSPILIPTLSVVPPLDFPEPNDKIPRKIKIEGSLMASSCLSSPRPAASDPRALFAKQYKKKRELRRNSCLSIPSPRTDWCENEPANSMMISLDELDSSDEETRFEEANELKEPVGNWTNRFQETLEEIRKYNANTPLDVQINGNAELLYLAQDFLHCAETYGRIIISERFVLDSEKTIKPQSSLGGVAGGEKYIVHHTLFKFAVDSHGMLGSDYAAAKVAGNELKGLICYFNAKITELRLPLMALVDYMGFRVIAMSLLPINKDTIVYGSNDGGIVLHNSNLRLAAHMKEAAENINLSKHICGLRTQSGLRLRGWQELYSAADVEGHVGLDGNFYLIDFSRCLPPEAPNSVNPKSTSHLYQLLRAEFIRAYATPLCSDAFSGFLMADPDMKKHNDNVRVATRYLHEDLIPRFVRDSFIWQVREAEERNSLHSFSLTEAIHAKGICMRHIGIILKHVRDEAEYVSAKSLLYMEAIARSIKNKLRALLRRTMKKVKQPLEAPYRQLVVRFFNLVFGCSKESNDFWMKYIKKQMRQKFQIVNELTADDFPIKKILILMDDEHLSPCMILFQRLVSLMGLKFTSRAMSKFKDRESCNQLLKERYPFDDTYLQNIGYRVKHMNIIAEALGSYYYYKGLRQSLEGGPDSLAPVGLLRTALEKYEEALGSNPTNTGLLKNAALCCTRMVELVESGGAHLEDVQFDPAAADIQKADQYYIRAIASDPDDAENLYAYAKFLWRCNRRERAEEYFLQSLETDPNFVWCLRDYGVLLSERGMEEVAEQFFVLASKKTNILTNIR